MTNKQRNRDPATVL